MIAVGNPVFASPDTHPATHCRCKPRKTEEKKNLLRFREPTNLSEQLSGSCLRVSIESPCPSYLFPSNKKNSRDIKYLSLRTYEQVWRLIMGKETAEVNVPAAIAELKEAIKDIIHEEAQYEDDFYLLRWLKATKFNLKKAEKKLRKTAKWRKEIDMPALSKETFPEKLINDVPVFVDTVTKDGAAVATMQAGLIDIPALFKEWGREKLVRHLMQAFGQAEQVFIELDRRKYAGQPLTEDSIKGGVFLIDTDKLSPKDMSSIDVIQTVTEVCKKLKKYFPLLACKLIAVNCTPVVDVVLKIARTILEKASLKFEIYGKEEKSKWHEALAAQIPVNLLRENFGGTRPKEDDSKRVNFIDKDVLIAILNDLNL